MRGLKLTPLHGGRQRIGKHSNNADPREGIKTELDPPFVYADDFIQITLILVRGLKLNRHGINWRDLADSNNADPREGIKTNQPVGAVFCLSL